MSTRDRPLSDLKVLDMSRVMAGPYGARLLCDLGADVVKLEPPEPDITRNWGVQRHGLSGFYTQQNAGKRNVCIDLKTAGGPELVRRLADRADVLVENFRPGVMARIGLDYPTLRERNPRLIMLSVTGFGQDGPESHRQAYAPIIHAEAGYIARHAEMDGNPPSDPIFSIATPMRRYTARSHCCPHSTCESEPVSASMSTCACCGRWSRPTTTATTYSTTICRQSVSGARCSTRLAGRS